MLDAARTEGDLSLLLRRGDAQLVFSPHVVVVSESSAADIEGSLKGVLEPELSDRK
jgi:hypothetical protein